MNHYFIRFGCLLTPCIWRVRPISNFIFSTQCRLISLSYGKLCQFEDKLIEEQNLLRDVFQYRTGNEKLGDVVVLMPRPKRGPDKKSKERAELLLDETITLVHSIPGWRVVGRQMISTANIKSVQILGKSNLKHFKDFIKHVQANAVVFAVDMLRPVQHHFFQEYFGVQIYDRFSIVLKIFREKASTKEAKLQLALAELNYVKNNLHHLKECDFSHFTLSHSFGGNFDTYYQIKKQLIQETEIKLKKELAKIDKTYEIKKSNRNNLELPSVAMVGYTNSGKTSLIKALTQDARLVPEDRLFATLDISVHMTRLPSSMKALLIDTIGFISDIPTTLVQCFKSTLNEICTANLIVHVIDSSHPDKDNQIATVNQTLREINVPEKLISSMVLVFNKIDKVSDYQSCPGVKVSATERIGLDEIKNNIEQGLIENTDRFAFSIRVPNGGEEYQWLYREASVVECVIDDDDDNYMIMKVIVTKSKLGRFSKMFRRVNIQ